MSRLPFDLESHERVEGGIRLLFQCAACGGRASLVILDRDSLKDKYPLACPCGAEANLVFGSPAVGKAILRKLKRTGDERRECRSPLLN
jgi:hypothetical protein